MMHVASLVIALVSLAIAVAVAVRNWRFSTTNVWYTARNQYMKALADLDGRLIDRPELWAVYDSHELSAERSMAPIEVARRTAFIYQHLSLFETVFSDFHRLLIDPDKAVWAAWDRWIRRFFEDSSEGRSVVMREIRNRTLSDEFTEYLRGILESGSWGETTN
jgi:hypothetical protein